MAENEGTGSEHVEDGGNSGADGANSGTGGKTFSQEEVNRIMAREKDQGRKAGVTALLQELGVTSKEDIAAILKQSKEAEAEKIGAAEAARREAETEREAAKREKAEAARERLMAKVERKLGGAGVPEKALTRAVRLIDLKDDADDDDIKAAIEELKEEMPQLFSATDGESENGKGPKHGDPGGPPKPKGGGQSSADKAKAMMAARHPSKVKTQ